MCRETTEENRANTEENRANTEEEKTEQGGGGYSYSNQARLSSKETLCRALTSAPLQVLIILSRKYDNPSVL
jgi:hypothetical protein